ncbi:Glycosyltransferase family 2 protein [Candidatus Methylobacter favarea]|uniref:Glycosyltransferase family 2 protein n=1 Tax=Candidatus Methylobacter favarea TaxID=2707345 RepID=A0A8S0X8S9_9GAMM|nr:glycosyltransferase family 2 protein [Candidatus Methylobacter favarea]CAA9891484.1 Glycosyltransferase family 2 protein [Candidatus Methylobacter favarea]
MKPGKAAGWTGLTISWLVIGARLFMLEQLQGKTAPLITIAMPVYNAGHYLRAAVLSMINQTFTDWELLIIDDGSTDEALQEMTDIRDERIIIFSDGINKGLAARLNEAIDSARGKYLARMDADDIAYPERLDRQIEALRNDPKLDLVATRAIRIDEDGQFMGLFPYSLSHEEICARPWQGFYFPHPTWMGKTDWFRKHRYAVPSPYFCEDQELLLRSYRQSRFATVPEILFAYRVRGKINPIKQAGTRWSLFKVQLRYFYKMREWIFGGLSAGVFTARILSDIYKLFCKLVSNCINL